MFKRAAQIFTTITLFLFIFNISYAATLSLTSIGALDTTDKTYTEWWYMGASPTLKGIATPGSSVSLIIGDSTKTVTTDGSGIWSYATSLEDGDYEITITSGEETVSFTLHMGQNVPASTTTQESSESTTAVPVTGFNQFVAAGLGIGVILLASYFYINEDSKRKSVFETRMLKED